MLLVGTHWKYLIFRGRKFYCDPLIIYITMNHPNFIESYTRPLKKRTTTIFPFRSPFKTKNVNCHEILLSDQILLKLECDVDEYLYLPCVGTKWLTSCGSVNTTLLSKWNSEYVLHLQSMKTIRCLSVKKQCVY